MKPATYPARAWQAPEPGRQGVPGSGSFTSPKCPLDDQVHVRLTPQLRVWASQGGPTGCQSWSVNTQLLEDGQNFNSPTSPA